jgi:drug/metabolite transporter (DMT)-like permease
MEQQNQPEWMMVLSVLAASTGAIFIRFAQREAPSLVIAAYRLGIGTLVLAPIALLRYRHILRRFQRQEWLLAILSGVFLALHFASWITSLEYTTVASSVVLVSMSPLLVALLSTFLLREPLRKAAWIGLVIAILGSVLIAFSQSSASDTAGQGAFGKARLLGNALAFAGAVFVAVYLIIGRKLRAKLPMVPYAFIVFGTAALVLLAAALFSGQRMSGYPPSTYLWFLLLGLVPQILGHAGFNWALRYLPASFVSISLLGEPIGSGFLALFLLNEVPSLLELFGGGMILTGIYLASQRNRNRS